MEGRREPCHIIHQWAPTDPQWVHAVALVFTSVITGKTAARVCGAIPGLLVALFPFTSPQMCISTPLPRLVHRSMLGHLF